MFILNFDLIYIKIFIINLYYMVLKINFFIFLKNKIFPTIYIKTL